MSLYEAPEVALNEEPVDFYPKMLCCFAAMG